MLQELRRWRCLPEDFAAQLCALTAGPGGDYGAACEQLRPWEQEGLLAYEGLRRRLPGPMTADPGR